MTFLIPWFATLGALIIGIAAYRDDEDGLILGCIYCGVSLILNIISAFV